MFIRFLTTLLVVFLAGPTLAQGEIDGLTVLGQGKALTDEQSNSTLVLRGLVSMKSELFVSMSIQQHDKEVAFYMTRATWDELKQSLIRTRDQWDTLAPKEFASQPPIRGYRIANKRATLQTSIQGKTKLDDRRLNFSITGDGNSPQRAFVSLTESQVATLVEQLYKVDEFLRYHENRK
jgi:hypothetical protein